ncbi:hypothetical protein [Hydrogenoanaerobacterium sp.]|uniref:hypothetical protein n=1 Tax=Hydrogenoanaerobacterium sp. TaxID=2953763 RepID=UPI0028A23E26|nr:hypothetical protein [Hydrogenoanaerobacterium sp.]
MTEFTTWATLATYTGAVAMTAFVTQFTKSWLDKLCKLPTQAYSYIVALIVLYAAYFFTGQLDASNAALILFNGFIVAAASNGVYEGVSRIVEAITWHRN